MEELQTTYWSVCLPEEWWAEFEEDVVVIGDNDDVSELSLSVAESDGEVTSEDVKAVCEELEKAGYASEAVELGGANGRCYEYTDEEGCWREWVLGYNDWLVYITYFCELEDKDLDRAAIDDILSTLAFREPEKS